MARPYSQDRRNRVVASVEGGRSRQQTAQLFGVGMATVVRWLRLLARLAEKPDRTLRALIAELAATGFPVSYGALWSFLAREGITFKKSLRASEQDRADIARRRQ